MIRILTLGYDKKILEIQDLKLLAKVPEPRFEGTLIKGLHPNQTLRWQGSLPTVKDSKDILTVTPDLRPVLPDFPLLKNKERIYFIGEIKGTETPIVDIHKLSQDGT